MSSPLTVSASTELKVAPITLGSFYEHTCSPLDVPIREVQEWTQTDYSMGTQSFPHPFWLLPNGMHSFYA